MGPRPVLKGLRIRNVAMVIVNYRGIGIGSSIDIFAIV